MFKFLKLFLVNFLFLSIISCNSKPSTPTPTKTPVNVTQNNVTTNTHETTNTNQVNTGTVVSTPITPIVNIKGFSQGQKFDVVGPFSSGIAEVKEYSGTSMSININLNVPSVPLPYEVKDGKINVDIKLEKTAESAYALTLFDINKNYKYYTNQVKITQGKTEAGWFSSAKDFVKISAYQDYTFTVENDTTISISTAPVPISLTLTKK
ncbi:MAG: hypothetical protein U0457_04125 [Candidatus Sericytochromatia bacterium]